MNRQPVAASESQSGNRTDGGSAQGAHWDLDLLTPDDVCALLKVKKSWLYDAVEDGSIETIRLGKQLRFRPSALVRYLEERASNANASRRS
jgi:excisionase family DNA binding protein